VVVFVGRSLGLFVNISGSLAKAAKPIMMRLPVLAAQGGTMYYTGSRSHDGKELLGGCPMHSKTKTA